MFLPVSASLANQVERPPLPPDLQTREDEVRPVSMRGKLCQKLSAHIRSRPSTGTSPGLEALGLHEILHMSSCLEPIFFFAEDQNLPLRVNMNRAFPSGARNYLGKPSAGFATGAAYICARQPSCPVSYSNPISLS